MPPQIGVQHTTETLRRRFNAVDRDKDGHISFREFRQMVANDLAAGSYT